MEEKRWPEWMRRELLLLPEKDWKKTGVYSNVCIVPTRKKHDSGYNLFAVVGCIDMIPVEIAGYMDDFFFGDYKNDEARIMFGGLRVDVSMHGVVNIHSPHSNICVGPNLSSTPFWLSEVKESG